MGLPLGVRPAYISVTCRPLIDRDWWRLGARCWWKIKSDPSLKRIPVVVLTTSKEEEDKLKTYNLRANYYITKPVDREQFVIVVKYIEDSLAGDRQIDGKR